MSTELWGLEKRKDEIIWALLSSLTASIQFQGFQYKPLFSGFYNLALVIHHQLKLNMKGPRRRNIISSF
jgi:hypothetical protein